MSGPGRNRLRRGVPRGMLGALLLIVLTERYVARHALEFVRPENWEWRLSARESQRQALKADVLGFGTSMVKMSVIPNVIEQRSGLRVYNLAVCGGLPPASYFLLRRALESGAKPRSLVVDFHPHFITKDHWQAVGYWPDLLDLRDALDLSWTAHDATFFAHTMLARSIPSIGVRFQIRAEVRSALRGVDQSLRNTNRNRNRQIVWRDRGALTGGRNPQFQGSIAASYTPMFLKEEWRCDPIQEIYIRRFLTLAANHGVPVYWLVPPLTPELQDKRNRDHLDAPYDRFAHTLKDEFANLVVLDGRKSNYEHEVFLDAAHLDRQGATVLSSDLADLLGHGIGGQSGSRWLSLPRYQEQPVQRFVEASALQHGSPKVVR
ncbi:MAG: hypothetical protein ABI353_15130 [Isosphaeraceae bacterium]